jgi:hypothetical protein
MSKSIVDEIRDQIQMIAVYATRKYDTDRELMDAKSRLTQAVKAGRREDPKVITEAIARELLLAAGAINWSEDKPTELLSNLDALRAIGEALRVESILCDPEGPPLGDDGDIEARALDCLTSPQQKIVNYLLSKKHATSAATLKGIAGAFQHGEESEDRAVTAQADRINARWLKNGIPWSIQTQDAKGSPRFKLQK